MGNSRASLVADGWTSVSLTRERGMRALSGCSSVDCSSVICKDDIPDDRVDLRCPAPPAENPVVTNSSLHVMAFHVRLEPAAQLVRRGGLANGADIIALPFDGEQR